MEAGHTSRRDTAAAIVAPQGPTAADQATLAAVLDRAVRTSQGLDMTSAMAVVRAVESGSAVRGALVATAMVATVATGVDMAAVAVAGAAA